VAEARGVGEAVAKAVMREAPTKAKRSSSGNALVEPAAPAAGVDAAEPKTGPVPVIGRVSVIGGVGVARPTAIVRIVSET
jgi:hypothetical protein